MPDHVMPCVKFLGRSHGCQRQFVTSLRLRPGALHTLTHSELSPLPSSILPFSHWKHCPPAASHSLCLYHHKVTKLTSSFLCYPSC